MKRGWLWFFAWTVVGVCFGFIVSQIAVFTLPVGALIALVLLIRGGSGREMLGVIEGVGVVSAVIGVINLNYRPCPERIVLPAGQSDYSCGGFDGTPWLITGLTAMLFAGAAYWWSSRGRTNRTG